ncbi:MAG: hypothetical protein A2X28_00550 [Elusimicrobia bacterium GWA2_56_46]|jgi:hypothetical protein|nr:MAG: hypothetical protein A2X28_00550 [Elusimicrobia bacterium GWA2_56_46]OGR55857.1 MAG: hypothetical protein A2X39_05925 [Elusimicrobia bacterium GWC2_56_31]HBB65967.1 hypothetical protein [Elusimicrobiota bacterium]HBW22210.1 hypothetical protein [Elusimicrobiota bacterium]
MKILLALLFLLGGPAAAQPAPALPAEADKPAAAGGEKGTAYASRSPVPAYLSLAGDLGRFYMYANGGFNADWYVGYNNSWIVKLPPVPAGAYAKAYLGAKLGRAKIKSWPQGWDKTPVPGKIYMAVSQEPSFTSDNMYFLADAADLPLEPLSNDSLEGVDSAQWFWAEVPLSRISSEKPNYLALWSVSRFFTASSSSPIVAAALSDDEEENVWLNRSIRGNPPSGDGVLETPISGLKPALAFKLVPPNDYKVFIKGFMGEVDAEKIVVFFSAIGEDIRAAWVEMSYDKFEWSRVGRYMFRPPYSCSLKRENLSKDLFYLRAAAVDGLENTGYSKEIAIPPAQKGE